MSLHMELKELIELRYGARLPGGVELKQDALILRFDSGLALEVRYVSLTEYAFHWMWGDVGLRVDTAPVHAGLRTYPNHLHDPDGMLRDDPLTRPGAPAWDNVRRVIDGVLKDPLLRESCSGHEGGVQVIAASDSDVQGAGTTPR
jgi:hypothetical protein